ncbi:hypothetical protein [Novosphingobium sp. JCM 18896]|uniref:hypothetical protein n=1 Tax=Novosphingobium sp. JCM 18896 TaxID=2989731 RepID=UPI0022224C63|nr:hypothetical protein [Novosphingobium sp. JCM 18896]MCW1429937.1 hypothetical protein [Novosphingobium sp. JCM 18896]
MTMFSLKSAALIARKFLYVVLLGILSIVLIGPTLPLDVSVFLIFSILGVFGFGQSTPGFAIGSYIKAKIADALAGKNG